MQGNFGVNFKVTDFAEARANLLKSIAADKEEIEANARAGLWRGGRGCRAGGAATPGTRVWWRCEDLQEGIFGKDIPQKQLAVQKDQLKAQQQIEALLAIPRARTLRRAVAAF